MAELRYLIPVRFDAQHVENQVGRVWMCPFCKAQSTSAKGNADTTWVQSPLRQSIPRWICLGCCIDIYSTALSEDFEQHPFRDILEQAAKQEGLNLSLARRICLEDQLKIAEERFYETGDRRYREVRDEISNLLQNSSQ